MNKLFCGIDLPLSTIFQSVLGSLLHPGTQTDAETTNKQTENTGGDCWKNIIKPIFCLHNMISLAGWETFRDNRLKKGSFYDGYSNNSCLHPFSSQFF